MEAIKQAGYDGKCKIGLDVAASEFKVKGKDAYDLDFKYDGNIISGEELGNLYQSLASDFPIVTIEDPFDEVSVGWANIGWAIFQVVLYSFVADSSFFHHYRTTGRTGPSSPLSTRNSSRWWVTT